MTLGASAIAPDVALRVGEDEHRGWTGVRAEFSMDQLAAALTLDITEGWSSATAPPEARSRRRIRTGDPCTLLLGGEVVLRGHVGSIQPDYDATAHRLVVSARDRAGDLVDSAATVDGPWEYAGIGLPELARRLAGPRGLTVRVECDCGPPFEKFAIQPGEKGWDALERACRQRAVLAIGDGQGAIVLTRSGDGGPAAGAILLGGNVLSARASFEEVRKFGLVVVRGQGAGAGRQRVEARATDPTARDGRVSVILAETAAGADLQARADWQVRIAAGRSRRVTYTVPGWRGESGALWRINTMVPVEDAYLGVAEELLVAGVTFTCDQRGTITELEIAPPDAFAREPEKPRDTGRKKAGGTTAADGEGWYRQDGDKRVRLPGAPA